MDDSCEYAAAKAKTEIDKAVNPYGIQPTGNAFLVRDPAILLAKGKGLGVLARISDEAILEMCSYLSAVELSKLAMVSKMTYIFAMSSDLWRDVCLAYVQQLPILFYQSWRDTFVNSFVSNNLYGTVKELVIKPHVPIFVQGAFSNVLYRMWACRNCDLNATIPNFSGTNNIARRRANSLSVEEFVEKYEIPNIPVIIEGAVSHWKAFDKWSDEYISEKCGDVKFRSTAATASQIATFTMKQYLHYAKQSTEEVPLYLFDRNFFDVVPELAADVDVPKYFSHNFRRHNKVTDETNKSTSASVATNDNDSEQQSIKSDEVPFTTHATDLFSVIGSKRRPDYRWLIAGPKRSGSVFHIDPNCTNAWNVCIRGRKKWIFYPKNISPPGVVASADGADVIVPLSTAEWLLSFWNEHQDAKRYWPEYAKPLETIVNPGELVFVPHNYWHMVINLDDCIAITQNYASTSNLSDVLQFLRDKEDQISGIRDRTGEAVQAEELYNEFVCKLRTSGIIGERELDRYLKESYRTEVTNTEVQSKKRQINFSRSANQNKIRKKNGSNYGNSSVSSSCVDTGSVISSSATAIEAEATVAASPFSFSFQF